MDRRRLLTLAGSAILATALGAGKKVRAAERFVDLPFANGEDRKSVV